MFVYSKLKEIYGERLDFQIEGYGRAEYKTTCDFIIKPSTETSDFYILDAKYKPRYENSQKGIISDIREMSGYAHDEKILAKLQPTSENISCVISDLGIPTKKIVIDKNNQVWEYQKEKQSYVEETSYTRSYSSTHITTHSGGYTIKIVKKITLNISNNCVTSIKFSSSYSTSK